MRLRAAAAFFLAFLSLAGIARAQGHDVQSLFEHVCMNHPIDPGIVAETARSEGLVSPPPKILELLEKIPKAHDISGLWQTWDGGVAIVGTASVVVPGKEPLEGEICLVAVTPAPTGSFSRFLESHHFGKPLPFDVGKLPPGAILEMAVTTDGPNGQTPVSTPDDPAIAIAQARNQLHFWVGAQFTGADTVVLARFDAHSPKTKPQPRSH